MKASDKLRDVLTWGYLRTLTYDEFFALHPQTEKTDISWYQEQFSRFLCFQFVPYDEDNLPGLSETISWTNRPEIMIDSIYNEIQSWLKK